MATPGAGSANTTTQNADPEQAQRKGGINNPTAGNPTPGQSAVGTTTQPSDPEQAQRKGTINQPGATTTTR
jgi:hypothetical protein